MGEANTVVCHLQVLVKVHLTPGPDTTVAVFVGSKILNDGLHLRAVRVSRIGEGYIPTYGEMAIGPRGTVAHESVKVGMGDVAL